MDFRILGPLEVAVDGDLVALGTPRQRALLGLLLVRAGEVVTADGLAEDLWAGAPPGTARHTVQAYVHRLRRALGPHAWRLDSHAAGYQLKVSRDELDAQRFEDLAGEGHRALVRKDPEVAADRLDRALGLWRGPVLADIDDVPAIESARMRLDALRMTATEDEIEAGLALGRHTALVDRLDATVTAHPFRERLWGQLMLALYRSGRQADALRAYDRARRILSEELGIDPSRWLSGLQERLLVQDPALDAPETLEAPRRRQSLPRPRTSFVGRRRELTELQGLLRTRRLVCVTGAGGSGKTRLAVEAAAGLLPEFAHGTVFVPLADVDDPELVAAAVATAFGITVGDRSPGEALSDHLRSRQVLLVLDNFEHVLAAAPLVDELLRAAPALTVLATSRAALRLSGEQEYPLRPLPLPTAGEEPADSSRNDAVALFADRAAAVDPSFALTGDNAALVAEVVSRLDGLPLAIELAAARLKLYALAELPRRLTPALPVLTRGPLDHAARQRTLRNTIAWSDGLLAPGDRALLRRLGVFSGGCTLEAVEAVASDPPVGDVVAGVSTLVDVSLLERSAEVVETRLALLDTTREYAVERLRAAGEEPGIRRRHAGYYAALAERAAPELTGAGQGAWLARLETEHANLRSALGWAESAGEVDLALTMAGRLWRFWQLRGHLAEGRRWLERLVAVDGAGATPRASAMLGLAGLCYWQFDLDAAETAYRRARELAARGGDWWLELEALLGLVSTIACHRGDLETAAPLEREFQALIAEHPEPMAVGFGMATSQLMRLFAGDLEGSRSYGERLVAACREYGQRWYEGQTLRTLALTSLMQGRHEQAEEELRACLDIAWEAGDLPGVAMDLERLGQVAAARAQLERAVVLAGAADRLRESVGAGVTVAAFRWETEHPRDTARRSLEPAEVARAWARGRTMTAEDAVAYALPA